jgi:phosphate transport system substrate-binding protein
LTRKLTILAAALAAAVLTVLAATSGAGASTARTSAGSLTGAGSTFVSKLVQAWVPKVQAALGIRLTYGPIGSGGGIAQITNRTVDFGASDAPMTADQFAACKGCVQIPWALSATSIPYHLTGATRRLKLTGTLLADIFLGKITRWNDPRIKKVNKGARLPGTAITVIHRSDGSGTTYNLTDYLSKVSSEWRSKVGVGTAVDWPTGVGAKGSSGVSGALSQTNGGISYVDVAFSLANHFAFASMQNKAGKFILPHLGAIKQAAKMVHRVKANNSGISIVNPPKILPLAYPICTFTYVIIPKQTSKATELKSFIHWALTKGQTDGPALWFQPIPKIVLNASLRTLTSVHG